MTRSAFEFFFKRPAALGPVIALLVLSACTPLGVVVGAGAGVGIGAVQERGLKTAAQDLKITAAIMESWIREDIALPAKIGIEVYEGRALLTGAVADIKIADTAVKLAWRAGAIKDVINEIQIGKSGIANFAQDSIITFQLKLKLTLDKQVLAINYAVETVNGTIYLIGIAQNQAELDRVVAQASAIRFVRNVISHVRVLKAAKKPA